MQFDDYTQEQEIDKKYQNFADISMLKSMLVNT